MGDTRLALRAMEIHRTLRALSCPKHLSQPKAVIVDLRSVAARARASHNCNVAERDCFELSFAIDTALAKTSP